MRRGFAFSFGVLVLTVCTPTAFGQYPYPYGPMPAQYGPMPYAPMPVQPRVYYPAAMQTQPMPTQPMPMWQAPAQPNKNVFIYGPLTDDVKVPAMNPNLPVTPAYLPPAETTEVRPIPTKKDAVPAKTTNRVTLTDGMRVMPSFSKADLVPESCGDFGCSASCGPQSYCPPMYGKGRFIGEVGAYFLAPVSTPRPAYSVTTAGNTSTTDFPSQVYMGPRVWLGYMSHCGWGVRGGYEYLRGVSNQTIANADPATTIGTPATGPFQLVSPGTTLGAGIGVDQFNMIQRLELNTATIEALKETHFLDTTFLFGFGGRYVRTNQGYDATRTNPGGTNGAVTVALDREDLESSNRFEGWGPTVFAEISHPLTCGFSVYGNIRGSFVWGNERFNQTLHTQRRTTDAAGVPTFVDTTATSQENNSREVTVLELETGVQWGHRCGRCYVFTRAGASIQRWWDVGTATNSTGPLSFVGGTFLLGVTY